jgi:hypothetical protein
MPLPSARKTLKPPQILALQRFDRVFARYMLPFATNFKSLALASLNAISCEIGDPTLSPTAPVVGLISMKRE